MDRKRLKAFQEVARKSHRVLMLLLACLCLLGTRIWYLSVYDRSSRVEEAYRARSRLEIISSPRGTICDRFSRPLAVNQVEYRLLFVWADVAEKIPRRLSGRLVRKEYIVALSKMIAQYVPSCTPQRIRDLIYSYAVYAHTAPIVLKAGLTEKEYCTLSARSAHWPGLRLEMGTKRHYQHGRMLCHVLGYTAPVQREEYEAVLDLRARLVQALLRYEECEEAASDTTDDPLYALPYDVLKKRLEIVERKLYTLHDRVGRTGIESTFESALRGFRGKRRYETNALGDLIKRGADSKEPVSGKRVLLTISMELQKVCEEILVQSESDRAAWLRSEKRRLQRGAMNPFIRGGSIVVLDAINGDVLALASVPRYDLNDFASDGVSLIPESPSRRIVSKKTHVKRCGWLQTEGWLARLWDGRACLEREVWNQEKNEIAIEKVPLSWKTFLELSIPPDSALHDLLDPKNGLHELFLAQRDFFLLKGELKLDSFDLASRIANATEIDGMGEEVCKNTLPVLIEQEKEILRKADTTSCDAALAVATTKEQSAVDTASYKRLCQFLKPLKTPREILAYIDLGRLVIRRESITPPLEEGLKEILRSFSIGDFRAFCQMILRTQSILHDALYSAYEEGPFQAWREEHETAFLKAKREEEKRARRVNIPYIQYIDTECERQFELWWKRQMLPVTAAFFQKNDVPTWVRKALDEIRREMKGRGWAPICPHFFSVSPELQKRAMSLITPFHRLQRVHLEGKYGVIRRFQRPKNLSHLIYAVSSMVSPAIQSTGYMLPTPPGSIFKLITASALLRNEEKKGRGIDPHFFTFYDHVFTIGTKSYVGTRDDGESIPQIYKGGRIPKSLTQSIGRVDLVRAIECSSNPYFSLAAAELLPTPSLLQQEAEMFGFGEKTGITLPGEAGGFFPKDLGTNKTAIYTTSIGQHSLLATPLQVATMLSTYASQGTLFAPRIVSTVVGAVPQEGRCMKDGYEKLLRGVGLDFPLWRTAQKEEKKQRIWVLSPHVRRIVPISHDHRDLIFTGMKRVVEKLDQDRRASQKLQHQRPELYHAFQEQKGSMLLKTSTAESYEALGLPYGHNPFMYSHTGVGALFSPAPISEKKTFAAVHPDIIVVVSLSYGSFGKEVGPIAARVASAWREIARTRSSTSGSVQE